MADSLAVCVKCTLYIIYINNFLSTQVHNYTLKSPEGTCSSRSTYKTLEPFTSYHLNIQANKPETPKYASAVS